MRRPCNPPTLTYPPVLAQDRLLHRTLMSTTSKAIAAPAPAAAAAGIRETKALLWGDAAESEMWSGHLGPASADLNLDQECGC